MPSKKNKARGKTPGPPPPSATPPPPVSNDTAAAPSAALPPALPANLPLPTAADDFPTKNARAKALIMSTLVPGSEPYKIAEPLELASDIWKALEDKYAPKDGTRMGRPSAIPEPPANHVRARDAGNEGESARPQGTDPERPGEAARSAPATDLREAAPPTSVAPHPETTTLPPLDSLGLTSLSQADDAARRRQIQHATTKVLMQKLPTRDLRFLWAVMYGGEGAPWPGSEHVRGASPG